MKYSVTGLSKKVWLICAIVLTIVVFDVAQWKNHQAIRSDVAGYYSYLPAVLLYQDISFEFYENLTDTYSRNIVWLTQTRDGTLIQKYPVGLAILYSPFFTLAHIYASCSAYPADGYSIPYQVAVILGGLFFALMGLYYLRKVLLKWFDEITTSAVLLVIAFATNLFYYSTTEAALSHIYSFGLFAMFIHFSIDWIEGSKLKSGLMLAIISSLIVLVRPVNGLIMICPMLYGVTGSEGLKNKVAFIQTNLWQIGLMAIAFLIVLSPQLFYWKAATGHWVYYSYVGEPFYFDKPHIIDGLFSYRKGWLVYTPVMTLSLIGIFLLRKQLKDWKLPIFLFTSINIYIAYSWWCWWYGGSFGARTMIESYALLSIPLGATIHQLTQRKLWLKILTWLCLATFIALNLFQTLQKRRGVIHYSAMTKEAYWLSFGKLYHPDGYWDAVQFPDFESARKGLPEKLATKVERIELLEEVNFDQTKSEFSVTDAQSPPFSLLLSKYNPYSPGIKMQASNLVYKEKEKTRLRASVFMKTDNDLEDAALIIQIKHPGADPYVYNYAKLKEEDEWELVSVKVKLPKQLEENDIIEVFVGNNAEGSVLVDDLKLEILQVEKY